MGCGASSTGALAPKDAWSRRAPPVPLRWPRKRSAKVCSLDATGVLPKKTAFTHETQEPPDMGKDVLNAILDNAEESQERLDVEEVELEARCWCSMNSEDVAASRQYKRPSPPDRLTHEWHLRRIDRLQQDIVVDPDLFETAVRIRRVKSFIPDMQAEADMMPPPPPLPRRTTPRARHFEDVGR
ncbi:unnamed protein product [Symbiodinium natans]|uniref:Uncharacterized protein n=1 Tax=Symbiodinium natans TaxID=878477 RepID=A0A812URX4_9DINO|nr:unnamed protein product [Symbiodinium natans]